MKGLSADNTIFSGIDSDIEKLKQLFKELQQQSSDGFKNQKQINSFKGKSEELGIVLSRVQQNLKEIAENKDNSFKFKNITETVSQITQLRTQIEKINQDLAESRANTAKGLTGIGFSETEAQNIANEVNSYEELTQKLKEITTEKEKQLQLEKDSAELRQKQIIEQGIARAKLSSSHPERSLATGKSSKGIYKNQNDAVQAVNEFISQELQTSIGSSKNAEEVWTNILNKINESKVALRDVESVSLGVKNAYNQINMAIQEDTSKTTQLDTQVNKLKTDSSTIANNFTVKNETQQNMQQLVNKVKELESELEKAKSKNQLGQVNKDLERTNSVTKNAKDSLSNYNSELDKTSQKQNQIEQSLNRLSYTVQRIFSIYTIVYKIRQIVTQTFNDVQNLDKSFASIAMVTDYTVSQMWDSYSQYAEIANQLGQSTLSAVESSALFYQQGLDTNEALELTVDTMKMATLAGTDFSTATSQMTAA